MCSRVVTFISSAVGEYIGDAPERFEVLIVLPGQGGEDGENCPDTQNAWEIRESDEEDEEEDDLI